MLGFRFHGTVLDAVAAVVVLVALAASMSALFGRIGDRLRRPDVVQFAGMMIMMPFMFVSGAFAPLETMPGWMQTMAAANPVAHATDALRGAVLGTGTVADTATALAAADRAVDRRHRRPRPATATQACSHRRRRRKGVVMGPLGATARPRRDHGHGRL